MFGTRIQPSLATSLFRPQQSTSLTMGVGASQTTGIDITSIMNLMIPMMIIGMMMKMMTGAMGTPKKAEVAAGAS